MFSHEFRRGVFRLNILHWNSLDTRQILTSSLADCFRVGMHNDILLTCSTARRTLLPCVVFLPFVLLPLFAKMFFEFYFFSTKICVRSVPNHFIWPNRKRARWMTKQTKKKNKNEMNKHMIRSDRVSCVQNICVHKCSVQEQQRTKNKKQCEIQFSYIPIACCWWLLLHAAIIAVIACFCFALTRRM